MLFYHTTIVFCQEIAHLLVRRSEVFGLQPDTISLITQRNDILLSALPKDTTSEWPAFSQHYPFNT